ncbi:MAG: 50S ribosomal protein L6 [Elusimicrobia bacterium]|nr:50S ribosomal protein L6 [Elusimicrobiota bacterium]
MSRLAKKSILIPEKVKVVQEDNVLRVEGPLGKLSQPMLRTIRVKIEGNNINVLRSGDARNDRMMQGLVWALTKNMINGVTSGFKKDMEIRGVGFNAQVVGNEIVLRLGFSHPVKYKIPEGIKITTDQKGVFFTVSGFDKQLVGETAAQIRRSKPPEHYKGTGIRYVGEYVIKKAGKAAVGVGGTGGAAGGAKK